MTKRTVLAWLFLLFYIVVHVQCARTTKDRQECSKAEPEDSEIKDQISGVDHLVQDGEGHPVVNRSRSSRMILHQAPREMPTQSSVSLIARAQTLLAAHGSGGISHLTRFDVAIASGCVLQVVLLTLFVVYLCRYGRQAMSPPYEYDNEDGDSEGSVLALGHGLDEYLWWHQSRSNSIITATSKPLGIHLIAPLWSCASLDDVFEDSGLTASWNAVRTDTLAEELAEELSQGKSSLFSKSAYGSNKDGLMCVIYLMQVALHYVPDNLILQEFAHPPDKNHFLNDDVRLPKTKIRNCEPVEECFMRCLTLKLGLSQEIAEEFASSAVLLRAEEEATTGSAAAAISKMSTVVRKLTVLVRLEDVDDELRKDLGIDEGNLYVDARGMDFRWERVGEDYSLRKLLNKPPDARKVKPTWQASRGAVLPWSASDINKLLISHGIAASSFGKGFRELVNQLKMGKVQLGIEEATEKLVCVEHRVYLKLSKKGGDFLVHECEESTGASLPYVVLLANETPWIAALRAARTQLGSVYMRVELQLHAQEVKTAVNPQPPKMFANGQPIAYVVREIVVEALAT